MAVSLPAGRSLHLSVCPSVRAAIPLGCSCACSSRDRDEREGMESVRLLRNVWQHPTPMGEFGQRYRAEPTGGAEAEAAYWDNANTHLVATITAVALGFIEQFASARH